MPLVSDIRKTVTDTTPVYVAVGVTDLAVERLRDIRMRVAAVHLDLEVSALQDKAVKRFEKVAEQAQQIPEHVRGQSVEVAGKVRETYAELAVRGEKLVTRIRNQKATKSLFAQAGNTMSLGKGAVTTVRKAAHDTQHAALVTLATGHREAGSGAASVPDDVLATGRTVSKSAAAGARKAATKATTASKTSTSKVGD